MLYYVLGDNKAFSSAPDVLICLQQVAEEQLWIQKLKEQHTMLKVDFKEAGWMDGYPLNKNVSVLSGAELCAYLPAVQIKPLLYV